MNGANDADVVIVGAGAAGLVAARQLSAAGLKSIVIEARDRIGGRIHTIREPGFPLPVELGAEFVHGTPAETWDIIRAAGLGAIDVTDTHWFLRDGLLQPVDDFWRDMENVFGRLKQMKEADLSFTEFLRRYCADVPNHARQMALAFVEGFDAADAERASARSIAAEKEASEEIEEDRNFRLLEGYDRLVQWLASSMDRDRVTIQFNTVLSVVKWSRGSVELFARTGPTGATEQFSAPRALITVPVGVMKTPRSDAGTIQFQPELRDKRDALDHLEMGPVIKTILRFDDAFWEHERMPTVRDGDSLRDACFLHARGPRVFTWWNWLPVRAPVIVGWSGGPEAAELSRLPDQQIVQQAIASLGTFLGLSPSDVASKLQRAHVHNWQADPFSRGAYSYTLVGGAAARRELAEPIDDTLFFAGEATHEGQSGTVAGAIASGHRAATEILGGAPRC